MVFLDRMSSKKKGLFLAVLGVLGAILVLLGVLGDKRSGKTADEGAYAKNPSTLEYIASMENKIKTIAEQITGSQTASVIVSLSSGTEYVYVSNEKMDGESSEKEYIKLRGDNGTDTLILNKEVYPAVTGVSIACRGGDDPEIQSKLIRVISTAFGVTSNRICIVGIKS